MSTKISKNPAPSRFATVISEVFNPLFLALPTFLAIALSSAPDLSRALLWCLVTIGGTSVLPLLFIWWGVRRGTFSDHNISKREQRFVPMLFSLVCILLTLALLTYLRVSRELIATIVSVIITCLIALIVTRFWKISLHLVGVAGMVTVFILLFGPQWLLLCPLVILVGWARWQAGAHTIWQAVAGTLLAITTTIATFSVFGLRI